MCVYLTEAKLFTKIWKDVVEYLVNTAWLYKPTHKYTDTSFVYNYFIKWFRESHFEFAAQASLIEAKEMTSCVFLCGVCMQVC